MFSSWTLKLLLAQHEIPSHFVSGICLYQNINGTAVQETHAEDIKEGRDFEYLQPLVMLAVEGADFPDNMIDIVSDMDPLVQMAEEHEIKYTDEPTMKKLMAEKMVADHFYIPENPNYPWASLAVLGDEIQITPTSKSKMYLDPDYYIHNFLEVNQPAARRRKTNDMITTGYFGLWEQYLPDYQKKVCQDVLRQLGHKDIDPEVAMPYEPEDAVKL